MDKRLIQFIPAIILSVILLPFTMSLSGCQAKQTGFGLILTDTGETLLTENDIEAYVDDENGFVLNESGIEKWNSHITYAGQPEIKKTLVSRQFIIKIDGEKICSGEFSTMFDSNMISKTVIFESVFRLDEFQHTLWIQDGWGASRTLNPATREKLVGYFGEIKLLKYSKGISDVDEP